MSKICIISPSLHLGGIERVLTMLANFFVCNKHRVKFISCLSGNHFYTLDENIDFVESSILNSLTNKFLKYFQLIFFIRKEVKKYDPDTIMVFGDYFSPFALMALSGTRYPIFISERMSPTYHFPIYIKLYKRIFYNKASGFIAQTIQADYNFKKRYGNRIKSSIIANPINIPPIIKKNKMNYVVVVARMNYDKGIDIALEVWSKVFEKKGWKMIFAGGGPLLNQMKDYAIKLGINEDVVFLGEVKNIYDLLNECSIFLLSSRGEGFPNAICEAMASGLACVCFEKLNNPMIISKDGFDGILVPDDDKDYMARIIYELIINKCIRDRIELEARKIIERLNIEVIGPHFLNFILSK